MSDIPDMRTDCIHLFIISSKCWVLVILMQETFTKDKGNPSFEHGINLGVLRVG